MSVEGETANVKSAETDLSSSKTLPRKESSNSESEPAPKICVVCSDNATGMHFGAITCEGCKGFFRRSVKKNANFKCAFEGKCDINKDNRKHCQACRFAACMAAGMNSSLILSDEEVNKKRDLIKMNREKRTEQQRQKKIIQEQERLKKLAEIGTDQVHIRMTMDEKLLLETLLKGHHESYDFGYKEYETFRGKDKIMSPNKKSNPLPSLAWLVASMTKGENAEEELASMQELSGLGVSGKSRTKPKQQENVATSQENLDVFSSLHGTEESQPCTSTSGATTATNTTATSGGLESEENAKDPTSGNEPAPTDSTADNRTDGSDDKPQLGGDGDSLTYLRDLLRSQGFSLSMVEDAHSKQLLQHFCDIMTWGIKKVIDFCKSIPEFCSLSLVDQIVLLRGGCLEMLVLRSYFAFSSADNTYLSEKFQYRPSDFLQAGGSKEFVEKYNNLHLRMRKMELQVEEICLLLALVLFSPDRPGLEERSEVEKMQDKVARTLQAYEYTHKPGKEARTMYCEILLILPILRTINMLFSANLMNLQETNESDMNALILEVNSSANADDED